MGTCKSILPGVRIRTHTSSTSQSRMRNGLFAPRDVGVAAVATVPSENLSPVFPLEGII